MGLRHGEQATVTPALASAIRAAGRDFQPEELAMIRGIIQAHPELSRRAISLEVCRVLGWQQPGGRYKERSCRVALLRLHEMGAIELPPPRFEWGRRHERPDRTAAGEPRELTVTSLRALGAIGLETASTDDARRSPQEVLWNELVDRYHFLGYRPIVGPQVKLLVHGAPGVLACMGFGAAFGKVRARDRWIAWTDNQRRAHLHLVVNQVRFLILPWIRCPCLASHLLALTARQMPALWQQRYGYRPLLMETYVHADTHKGTCYRAANWLQVGTTSGYGKWKSSGRPTAPPKLVFLYPLVHNPRARLAVNPDLSHLARIR